MESSREQYQFSPDGTGVLLPRTNHGLIGLPYREAYLAWESHLAGCPQCAHGHNWAENACCLPGAALRLAADEALAAQRTIAHAN